MSSLNNTQDAFQPQALERLMCMHEKSSLPHSLLFMGGEGWGKVALAEMLARLLVCEQSRASVNCTCNACIKVAHKSHPDVSWYGRDTEKRYISIAEIRMLLDWMHLRPFEARFKVAILIDAERMTTEAQNAMLKLLEEPPASSCLVLLTSHPELLLDTVRSRCVTIRLKPVAQEAIYQTLLKEGADGEEARYLSKKASGSLTKALALKDAGDWEEERIFLENFTRRGARTIFQEWARLKREEIVTSLYRLESWLRDLWLESLTQDRRMAWHPHARVQSAAATGVSRVWRKKIEYVVETEKALRANVNQKLALARLAMLFES